jgi:hypothetical protein
VWICEKKIDPVELNTIDFGRNGEVEHRIEVDRRLRVGAFAD